ncbi:MAG: DUF1523 family protein [Silicimonas sp.]|nr:DUF1523 family protein [Silicimonas sp.]
MTYIRWTFRIFVLLLLGSCLHYTLPQQDIVRIVDTYEERQDFGGWTDMFWQNTGAATADAPITRDVLFIQGQNVDNQPMVYRNQDTGWGWPPYFKFDTANLKTEADDAVSTPEDPKWYAIRHYGWRITWLGDGIFPNALSMKAVAGPDVQLIPWFNIIIVTILAILLITIWRLWRNFWDRRVDPVLDDIEETGSSIRRFFGRR